MLARATRAAMALLCAGGVASCLTSAGGPVPGLNRDVSAGRVLLASYRAIADRYIDERDFQTLTVSGLNGLASVDDQIRVETADRVIRLMAGDRPLAQRPTPASSADSRAWADVAAELLEASADATPKLSRLTRDRLLKETLDGVLRQLDKNSRYADPLEARDNRFSREGAGGIGVTVQAEADYTVVTSVQDGAPAAQAGLRAGDRIVAVEATRVIGQPMRDVVRSLRGRVGDQVSLTVFRPTEGREIAFTLKRQLIIPTTATLELRGDIAHVKLTGFNSGTTDTVKTLVQRAKAEAPGGLAGLILDMRGNPGGLLDQAISVADLFLESGLVLTTDGRHPDSRQTFRSSGGALLVGVPVVAVMNGRSASAAEILGAALQDRGRAILVGSASYGKGTVQTVVRLPNEGEMTLTWSRMHAPSGYAWHELGVLPTVCTSQFATPDTLSAELDGRAQSVRRVIAEWHTVRTSAPARLQELRAICPPVDDAPAKDIDLAERLLRDRALYARALGYTSGAIAERK